jgi:hypothetical protein
MKTFSQHWEDTSEYANLHHEDVAQMWFAKGLHEEKERQKYITEKETKELQDEVRHYKRVLNSMRHGNVDFVKELKSLLDGFQLYSEEDFEVLEEDGQFGYEDKLKDALEDMIRLVRGDDESIYRTCNPYCRPAMKKALKVIAEIQGIDEINYLDADIPKSEK